MAVTAATLTRHPIRTAGVAVAAVAAVLVAWLVADGGSPLSIPAPAPAAALPAPPAAGNVAAPQFDIVRVTPEGGVVLAGRAEPGATVTVTEGQVTLAVTQADSSGSWVAIPAAKLQAGAGELTLSALSADGTVHTSPDPVLVVVPERAAPPAQATASSTTPSPAPAAPIAQAPPAMAVLTPVSQPSRLLQPPSGGQPTGRLALGTVDYDDHGAIRFSGSAPAGVTVRVYIDNAAVADATADSNGHWALSPSRSLAAGVHQLRLDQVSDSGKVASRIELPFERETLALSKVKPGEVVVQPGQNLWRLARRVYGTGLRYTVIFVANRDQIRDIRLIYPGQVFKVPGAKL